MVNKDEKVLILICVMLQGNRLIVVTDRKVFEISAFVTYENNHMYVTHSKYEMNVTS